MSRILVLGSLNMDLVARTERFPEAGETVSGSDFRTAPGGKGANQAVAAARLATDEVEIGMVGRVGDDGFGRSLLDSLSAADVDTGGVAVDSQAPTGTALITVNAAGENSIVIVAGANGRCDRSEIKRALTALEAGDILLLQLEIPLATVQAAARQAAAAGVRVILDPAPAPAQALPEELRRSVDVITPNETEAAQLTGTPVSGLRGAERAANEFLRAGSRMVIVTLGAAGALVADGSQVHQLAAPDVQVVDTTAAGDAFNGALAAAMAAGADWPAAGAFAVKAGSLTVTQAGAQPSLPSRTAVQALS